MELRRGAFGLAAAAARAGRLAAVVRGARAARVVAARVAEVRRRAVARAGVVRAVLRRRAVVVRAAAVLRLRAAARGAVARRVAVRRAGLRAVRGAAALRLTAASSFFSMSARRFSNALSWVETVLVSDAAVGAVRVVRRAVVLRAVVLRAVVLRAAVRLVAGLRVVRAAGRAVVRLLPVLLGVRGMVPIPPSGFSARFCGALKFRSSRDIAAGCGCDVSESAPNRCLHGRVNLIVAHIRAWAP